MAGDNALDPLSVIRWFDDPPAERPGMARLGELCPAYVEAVAEIASEMALWPAWIVARWRFLGPSEYPEA